MPTVKELGVRRQERATFREEELEAAAARVQRQREEYIAERQFLQNYASNAQLEAEQQQAWAAAAAQRTVALKHTQADLHAQLCAARRQFADEQAMHYNCRMARAQEEAATALLRRQAHVDIANLHSQLQASRAGGEGVKKSVSDLRLALQATQASSEAEALTAQRRLRGAEEAQSQGAAFQREAEECQVREQVTRKQMHEEAVEHQQQAAWERTLLEAQSAERSLKLEAFEQRCLLARRHQQSFVPKPPSRQHTVERLVQLLP
ncbi:unnamed protein product [Polarella glacialis]|uniref:Uncharacterized protein n=1 Tax=Polarella glacialis TaxID=89957 RepID=A0A813LSS3_POLGL|nr:unnamed protein product [Polarella glacialis]